MHCTAEGVTGNHLYSARGLALSEPDDLVQLHPHLESEWDAISAHYRRVGLAHSRNILWTTRLEQISRHRDLEPSVFFFGRHERRAHPDPEWADVVEYINSKNHFIALAERLGVPVPKTICYDHADEIGPEEAAGFAYPCYLKAAVSVSGVGIYRCENPAELLQHAADFATGVPVQVQEEVQTDCFLNIQYRVEHGHAQRLLVTEQILDGPAHQGNSYPARAEPWDVVEPMAEWIAERGFKDIFAFDVAVVEDEAGPHYLAIECNPRYNGASYPTAIAMKLGIEQWSARNYRTYHRSLQEIDLDGIEFDAKSGQGVILVNWGPIATGKLMVMLAGPLAVQNELDVVLRQRLW
jgi:hypothetical protein